MELGRELFTRVEDDDMSFIFSQSSFTGVETRYFGCLNRLRCTYEKRGKKYNITFSTGGRKDSN